MRAALSVILSEPTDFCNAPCRGDGKVNGEFNLVWQPPFPLTQAKEEEEGTRERESSSEI